MGATQRSILLRILAESITVALLALVPGGAIGFFAVKYVLPLLNVPPVYPVKAMVVSALFSLGVCLFAGYFPAKRASSLNPVDALRKA